MKHRTQDVYQCPFCCLIGWRRKGEFEAHLRKTHGKPISSEDAKLLVDKKREEMRKS